MNRMGMIVYRFIGGYNCFWNYLLGRFECYWLGIVVNLVNIMVGVFGGMGRFNFIILGMIDLLGGSGKLI